MHIKTILLIFILAAALPSAAQYVVTPVFTLKESMAIIEGMTYDPVGNNFYFGESTQKKILRYTRSGKSAGYIDAAKDGMTSVLGMWVNTTTHHLWICGASDTGTNKVMCMFEYDLKNDMLVKKYPDTSRKAKLFNDVTITDNGSVYVTDTYSRTIYTADTNSGTMKVYLENDLFRDANGITSHKDTIYVSTSRGIIRIDSKSKQFTSLPLADFMIAGIDGLYYHKNSVIGIQNVFFPVTISRYYINNINNTLSKAEVLAADHSTFVIPTTGVVVKDNFYFMSNNNLGTEHTSLPGKVNMKKIKPVTIARISLKKT